MTWKSTLNGILTAALSGAASAVASSAATGSPVFSTSTGIVAATGAFLGILNLFRAQPHKASEETK